MFLLYWHWWYRRRKRGRSHNRRRSYRQRIGYSKKNHYIRNLTSPHPSGTVPPIRSTVKVAGEFAVCFATSCQLSTGS